MQGSDYPRMPGEELNTAVIYSLKRVNIQKKMHKIVMKANNFPFILFNIAGYPCISTTSKENKNQKSFHSLVWDAPLPFLRNSSETV